MKRRIGVIVAAVILVVVVAAFPALATLLTDLYWFQNLGYESIFLTRLGTKVTLVAGVGIAAALFLYLNLRLAQRGLVPNPVVLSFSPKSPQVDVTRILRRLSLPVALVLALPIGASAAGSWLTVLRFFERTPFGVQDPVFARDIGYYVFTLPAVAATLGLIFTFLIGALFVVLPIYILRRDIVLLGKRMTVEPSAQKHVAALIASLFVVVALNTFFVRIPSLLFSDTGPLFGASYTDLKIRLPAFHLTWVIALVGAAFIVWGIRSKNVIRNTAVAVVGYLLFAVLSGGVLPGAFQKLVVAPNELVKETPQLDDHIEATRAAWGLDEVIIRDLSGEAALTLDDIEANEGTIKNVRLWDREPLLQTFGQLQEIRTYYDFVSVDDDRYWIDGEYRQVLLSARELNSASVPNRNFINERLTYTHGMGLTLSPVNQVSPEGLPVLFIKDLPPESDVSIRVTEPAIYYGELSNDYVFVNSDQREFDYPLGDTSAFTSYQGRGGVPVSSAFRKLLFSMRFGSLDVLLTELITPESRVMFNRLIRERVRKALPFLSWDDDPYLVVTEAGELKWILDAYTHTSLYPYSQPLSDGTNYMSNSVKVVLDAFHGDLRAYISDPEDPLILSYAKIFDGVFLPLEEMPSDLRAHIRYPEDLFQLQTSLYTTYHMNDPEIFYAREDQWQIPSVSRRDGARDPFLRHIVMKLPGVDEEEFIFMVPFTPRQKDNLAAWMVARSDGADYGELVVYRFPRQSLVFGPTQIVNRINQDTEISRQISLWDQRGSEVIRGNLLVIPIEEALIFVQALYLRAEGGRIPELKRVVVAYQNRVVMEETLAGGLARLFGGSRAASPVDSAEPLPEAAVTTDQGAGPSIAELIQRAQDAYERALTAQRSGDWARYGEEMRLVGELLRQLRSAQEGDGGA